MARRGWSKFWREFISIFVAVISAFALNNWNDNRKDTQAATKILTEISNGLEKDLIDIYINSMGHKEGIASCNYWLRIINGQDVDLDSLAQYYLALTRDFFSAQNNSGYETLKSKGLELLENDDLRYEIISLYEYDYASLKTMEETYHEMQFQENYFKEFNNIIAPHFSFTNLGQIETINLPLQISEDQKQILRSYLWKIRFNRNFILTYYGQVEKKVQGISDRIQEEIK